MQNILTKPKFSACIAQDPSAKRHGEAFRALSAERFRDLMASAPAIDSDFVDDVIAIRKESDVPESPWPS